MHSPTHNSFPPIETERLELRAFAADDLEALFTLHSDADLVRWIPWGPRSREEVGDVLDRKRECTSFEREGDGLGFAVCLRETGEMIGDFTLQYESERDRTAEIGFMLLAAHQGKGYACEGATAILGLAFEDLGLHRVIARLEARNDSSATVCERLGMRREALHVDNEWIKGEWQSELIYALLEREWADSRRA
jgi:RimJ/RimL family protein N-acetyltransferase